MAAHAWQEGTPPSQEQVAILSGLSGEEMTGLIDAWEEHTGTTPAFASVSEGILDRPLAALVSQIARAATSSTDPRAVPPADDIAVVCGDGELKFTGRDKLKQQLLAKVVAKKQGKQRRNKAVDRPPASSAAESGKPPKRGFA